MENADRSRRRLRALAGVVGLGVVACGVANAAPVTWTGTAGDSFTDGTKWTPAAPTSADVAIFDNNTTGNVNFGAAASAGGLAFRNTSGALNLALAGNTLTLGTSAVVGSISLGGASGQVNDVTIGGGPIPVPYTGTAGTFLTAGFSGSNGNKITFSGANTLVTATSTAGTSSGTFGVIGPANSNNNSLIIENGATVDWRGNVNVGIINASPALASTGNVVTVNSATFNLANGNRGLMMRNATLNLTNSYSDIGILDADDAGNSTTINFNSGALYLRAARIENGRNFVIGDGGSTAATYGVSSSGGSMSIGSVARPVDLVINSNGALTGTTSGAGMITVHGTGVLRGVAGAKVAPSIIGNPALTSDDRATGTINFTGKWDNTDLTLLMDIGDFPAAAAAVTPFVPLDFINITGAFVHGGTVSFDTGSFVPPVLPTEYKVVGWTTEQGLSSSTSVEFVNGISLPYRFDTNGLYLMVPEPGSLSVIAAIALFAGRRRLR